MDQAIIDWATLVGTGLTAIGVLFAIVQISRTGRAARAAATAAEDARAAISGNVLLIDVSATVGLLKEVKAHVRASRWESALLRLADARSSMIQIRSITRDDGLHGSLKEMLVQLAVLRDVLEQLDEGGNPEDLLDRIEVIRILEESSDVLNGWLGQAKFLEGSESNDP